jgi:hypothetical protein
MEAGVLTEDDVLKLVKGAVSIERLGQGRAELVDADFMFTWEEATQFTVVLADGKAAKLSATFSDAYTSKTMTFLAFKRLAAGMSQEEIEQLLGRPTRVSSIVDDMNVTLTTCIWWHGRRIEAYIKDGKVNGGGYSVSGTD